MVTLATLLAEWATASAPLTEQSGVLSPKHNSSQPLPELVFIAPDEMAPGLLVLRLEGRCLHAIIHLVSHDHIVTFLKKNYLD